VSLPVQSTPASLPPSLTGDERRWLHDKYERLASDEASLSDSRTSYFAAIASGLVAAFVVLVVNELTRPLLLVVMTLLLAAFGILLASIWTIVLRRTVAAQTLWRESALLLERDAPPILPIIPATVTLRPGETIQIDLSRPYLSHETRFTDAPGLSWIDRVRPSELSANVPAFLILLWITVIAGTGIWYLFLQ
jgi:hypothetical protein